MTLTSTSAAAGRRAARAGIAAAVALALFAPAAFLFTQVWSSTGSTLAFTEAERRGVAYLGPLTELLSVVTEAQSAAVRGSAVDPGPVQTAIKAVDEVDGRLGAELRTTERWTAVRQTVQDRTRSSSPVPTTAYQQYSALVTTLVELDRKVGDVSKLILDPELDSHYVMNATLLRIPEILVDSGQYADLTVLASRGDRGEISLAQLAVARNRVAADAADLIEGLRKAFGATRSPSLGAALTGQLDDFHTAVDAVAPSYSLLAPAPERSLATLAAEQDELQRATLALQRAALAELDLLLRERQDAAERTRLLAMIAFGLAALIVVVAAIGLRPAWLRPADIPDGLDAGEPPGPPTGPPVAGAAGGGRELVAAGAGRVPPGGTRAAR